MTILSPSPRLDSAAGIDWHLDRLLAIDPRLIAIREQTGTPAPRSAPQGFGGMAKVVCGQQLSVASASAIWGRFAALEGTQTPQTYLDLDVALVRATGFSAGKDRTMRVIAEAMVAGELDFTHLETLPVEQAVAYLTTHKGIGPWTAEVYLMFCASHPDVFPAGDLALLKAVHHGLGLAERPSIRQMGEIACLWAPHRSAAALLFWRYFAVRRDQEGLLL